MCFRDRFVPHARSLAALLMLFGFVQSLSAQILGVTEITRENQVLGYWTHVSLDEIQLAVPTDLDADCQGQYTDPYIKVVPSFGTLTGTHPARDVLLMNANFFSITNPPHTSLCSRIYGTTYAGGHQVGQDNFAGTKFNGCDMVTLYFKVDDQGFTAGVTDNPGGVDDIAFAISGLELKAGGNNCYDKVDGTITRPRTAIGFISKRNLIVATWNPGRGSKGATLDQVFQFMFDRKAKRVINLDGGGSAVLMFGSSDTQTIATKPSDIVGGKKDRLYRPAPSFLAFIDQD